MKAHVIYDSYFGNTKKIAEVVADELKKVHTEVMVLHVDDFISHDIDSEDILVTCSPTRAFHASPKMTKKLKNLFKLNNMIAVVIDTRIDMKSVDSKFLQFMVKHFGYAADSMAKTLSRKGAKVIGEKGFFVNDSEGPLKDGELDRARQWIEKIFPR